MTPVEAHFRKRLPPEHTHSSFITTLTPPKPNVCVMVGSDLVIAKSILLTG